MDVRAIWLNAWQEKITEKNNNEATRLTFVLIDGCVSICMCVRGKRGGEGEKE